MLPPQHPTGQMFRPSDNSLPNFAPNTNFGASPNFASNSTFSPNTMLPLPHLGSSLPGQFTRTWCSFWLVIGLNCSYEEEWEQSLQSISGQIFWLVVSYSRWGEWFRPSTVTKAQISRRWGGGGMGNMVVDEVFSEPSKCCRGAKAGEVVKRMHSKFAFWVNSLSYEHNPNCKLSRRKISCRTKTGEAVKKNALQILLLRQIFFPPMWWKIQYLV